MSCLTDKVSTQQVTGSIPTDGTFLWEFFDISGVEAGQYSFRVAPQFADGSKGAFSTAISGTVTGSPFQRGQFDMKQLVAVMAIVGTISILILILCLGMACLYKKHHVASTLEQQNAFVHCNSISPNVHPAYPCELT